MEAVIFIARYVVEVIKYTAGLQVIFQTKLRISGAAFCWALLYLVFGAYTGWEGTLLMYAFAGITVYTVSKGPASERVFQIIVLLCMISGLEAMIDIAMESAVSGYEHLGLIESVSVLAGLLFLKFIKKRRTGSKKHIEKFITERILFLVPIMMLIMLLAITGYSNAEEYVAGKNFNGVAKVISFLAFMGMILLFMFIIYIKKANEAMRETVAAERSLKMMQKKYYNELLEREEETRRYRHDMQNHLLCLSQYLEKKEVEKGAEYIQGLQASLTAIQKSCYVTGNDLLDLFLNHYLLPLENVNINIWGNCSSDILIDDMDFCIIFSNLIQNAAEAVTRQKDGEKYIRVILKQREEHCEIDIENSMEEGEADESGTAKDDKKNHGFGLKNVSEAVSRSGGYYESEVKNGEFSSIVILKRKSVGA